MKVIERISDVMTILQKSRVSKDSRITQSFVLSRINNYRAKEISDSFERNGYLDAATFQDMGAVAFTPVSSTDDPSIPKAGCTLGKYAGPAVVNITGGRGIYRVSGASKGTQYTLIEAERFFELVDGTIRAKFPYVFQIGHSYYTHPFKDFLNCILILENPMDGVVINTQYPQSGELVYTTDYQLGEQYIVTDGGIYHNGVHYNTGQIFTAVNPNYTGAGKIKAVNRKRKLNYEDEYPMSSRMFEVVLMKILQKDFQLEKREIADVMNNASDEIYLKQEGATAATV